MTVLDVPGMVVPVLVHEPPGVVSSAGEEAIEFAETCGIVLDDWQRWAVMMALAERKGGRWAAFEVGLVMPRQNGKNFVLRAIQVACLFLFGDRTLAHSAHQFDTCEEHRLWLMHLLEDNPTFGYLLKPTDPRTRRSKSFVNVNGNERIELTTGQRILFKARSRGKGRGFTGDKVFFDEAQALEPGMMGDTVPILSTIPHAQLYYTGSAHKEDSRVLHAVRARAVDADPKDRLFYAEWGNPPEVLELDPRSPEYMEAIERANPAVAAGRIEREYVEQEIRTFSGDPELVEEHRRERLGVPTFPAVAGGGGLVDIVTWGGLVDEDMVRLVNEGGSVPLTVRRVALAVSEDRRWAAIGRAGRRENGRGHVECFWRAPGTGWVVDKLRELARLAAAAGDTLNVLVGAGTAAAALVKDLNVAVVEDGQAGLVWSVEEVPGTDQARALGMFIDAARQGKVWHLGQAELSVAVEYAVVVTSTGGAKRLAPAKSKKDISPLEAVTLAFGAIPDVAELEPEDVLIARVIGGNK